MKIDLERALERYPAALPRVDLRAGETINGHVLDMRAGPDGPRTILMARSDESDLVELLWPNDVEPVGEVLAFLLKRKRDLFEDGRRLGLERDGDWQREVERTPLFFPHVEITCVWDGTMGEEMGRDPSVSVYELRLFP